MEINNRTVRLNERPNGLPEKKIWSFNEENFDLKLDDNQVIIKNEFVNLTLGRIDFIDKQPVVVLPKKLDLDNLRVLIND